jgi:hypothetical protein
MFPNIIELVKEGKDNDDIKKYILKKYKQK